MSSAPQRRVALLEQDDAGDNLHAEMAAAREYYACRPAGFVRWAFPGKRNAGYFTGPDDWQGDFLEQLGQRVKARGFDGTRPVDAIRMATALGHELKSRLWWPGLWCG